MGGRRCEKRGRVRASNRWLTLELLEHAVDGAGAAAAAHADVELVGVLVGHCCDCVWETSWSCGLRVQIYAPPNFLTHPAIDCGGGNKVFPAGSSIATRHGAESYRLEPLIASGKLLR